MGISYLSKPNVSTVVPFREPVDLILQAAAVKEGRYERVLDTIFSQENSIINLETTNQNVTNIKNQYVAKMEKDLSSMAKLDFMNPDNIQKAEGLFKPIMQDQNILKDLAYTKIVKQDKEFREATLKKDPSAGNKANAYVDDALLSKYVNAPLDKMDEAAQYIGVFTPYVDTKGKIEKAFKDLGIMDGGKMTTTIVKDGIKYVQTVGGLLPEAEVMARVNGMLTDEDRHQMMLSGYMDYSPAGVKTVLDSYQKQYDDPERGFAAVSKNLDDISTRLKKFDENGDGKIDDKFITGEDANANLTTYNSLMTQQNYLQQRAAGLGAFNEYVKKYNENGQLSLNDEMSLYAQSYHEKLTQDLVSALSRPDGNLHEFTIDTTDAWKDQQQFLHDEQKAKLEAEKAKKEKPGPDMGWIDANKNGIKDETGDIIYNKGNWSVSSDPITESMADLVSKPVSLKIGADTYNGSWEGRDYKAAFEKQFGKDNDNTKLAEQTLRHQLEAYAYDGNGTNQAKLAEVTAAYNNFEQAYKTAKDDKTRQALIDNPEYKKYNFGDIYQGNKLLSDYKSFTDIDGKITNSLAAEFKPLLQKARDGQIHNYKLGTLINQDNLADYYKNSAGLTEDQSKKLAALVANKEVSSEVLRNYGGDKYKFFKEVIGEAGFNEGEKLGIDKQTRRLFTADLYSPSAKEDKTYSGNAAMDVTKRIVDKINLAVNDNFGITEEQIMGQYYQKKQEIYKQLLTYTAPLILHAKAGEEGDETKNDPLRSAMRSIAMGYIKKGTSVLKNDGGEWEASKDSFPTLNNNELQLETFSPSTGELTFSVTAKSGGLYKIQVDPKTAAENGFPLIAKGGDALGKALVYDSYVKTQGDQPSTFSKSYLVFTDPTLGDVRIAHNTQNGGFSAFYMKEGQMGETIMQGDDATSMMNSLLSYRSALGLTGNKTDYAAILSENFNKQ